MFSGACTSKQRSLRVREDNPANEVPAPDRGVRKVKTYLCGSAVLTRGEGESGPLKWRRLFAVAVQIGRAHV